MFIESDSDNTVTIINSSVAALKKLQAAMEGEAEKAGIMNDDDILDLCADVRRAA